LNKRTHPNEHQNGWRLMGGGQQIYGTNARA